MTTYDELLAAVSCTDGREIFDPATSELVGQIRERSRADLNAAIAGARAAQSEWAARSHEERSAALNTAADAIEAHADALA